ncbi:LPS assembly lipoprotein LptE [Robbsia sp. KACC 23696]|uniref:LPS-assembly lipoprotein LptE n=1 Tax=Robbsia sp. KACC 23696 TaxID=3149231 RepID=UPI00325C33BB
MGWLAGLAVLLTLGACGFQLRGSHDYPFKHLLIAGNLSPEMKTRMKRMIESGSDTRLVSNAKDADAILSVSIGRGQNSLSFDINGVTQEYQLTEMVSYTLTGTNGATLIPPSSLSVNRAMGYNTTYSLAKATESEVLYRDMESDIVDQLLRRLDVVQSMSPARPQAPGVNQRSPLPTPPL